MTALKLFFLKFCLLFLQAHEKRCSQKQSNELSFDSPRSSSSLISISSHSSNTDGTTSGYSSSTALNDSTHILPTLSRRNEPDQSKFQALFLENIGLFPVGKIFSKKEVIRPKASSYARFVSIELCSPLGQSIIQGGNISVDESDFDFYSSDLQQKIEYQEPKERKGLRSETTGSKNNCVDEYPTEFPITYKKPKAQNLVKEDPFIYSFNKRQRQMRFQELEQGKSILMLYNIFVCIEILVYLSTYMILLIAICFRSESPCNGVAKTNEQKDYTYRTTTLKKNY